MAKEYTKEEFDVLVNRIKFITTNHAEIMEKGADFFEPAPVDDGSPDYKKSLQMAQVLKDTDFGCQQDYVRQLFEILLGYPIVVPNKANLDGRIEVGNPYMCYCAVVPLQNNNGNNYTIGRIAVLLHSGRRAMRHDGSLGNDLPRTAHFGTEVRLATSEEIDTWAVSAWDFLSNGTTVSLDHPPCRETPPAVQALIDTKMNESA